MAKRKRKSSSSSNKVKVSMDIVGLILVLFAIIGIGQFGIVGDIIKQFSVFVFGSFGEVLIALIFILGVYMIFKRKLPNFFSKRLIGLYFVLIAALCFAHMEYTKDYIANGSSFKNVFTDFIRIFSELISRGNLSKTSAAGGGVVGLAFSLGFAKLLDITGTYIALAITFFFGLILILNIEFSTLVDKIANGLTNFKNRPKKEKKIRIKEEDDEEDDDKVVVSSVEDLKKYHTNEEVKPTSVVENVPMISINTNYKLPTLDKVLDPLKKNKKLNSDEFIKTTSISLQNVLADFGIIGKVVAVHEGPTVTQFELAIKNGTKVSKITGISKEIALALAAKDVRIEAPIPGKTTVGIEIPNKVTVGVPIREVLETKLKEMADMKLPVSLGKDINGNLCITDLAKTPHLLVAGSTGSGKSVCVNSFINSLLITKRPDEVKLVLVDPKKVELSNYNGIPHLLCPVVTDPKKASVALKNIVKMMEDRYNMFADEKVKNITGYNEKIADLIKKNPDDNSLKLMPYILVIIDELADLMLVASKEVEDSIMRITQMARAAGIHLIVATQRPSTDVITGVVKANIPSRISFAVASQIDSRTILDSGGAEKLLGKGDMLFKPMGENFGRRIQGNFISDAEIERVIAYVSHEQIPQYDDSIMQVQSSSSDSGFDDGGFGNTDNDDPLYNEIVDFVIETGKVSASLLQRKFRLGYNRAARIVDLLEERGIIGPANGSKPREVLVKMNEEEG